MRAPSGARGVLLAPRTRPSIPRHPQVAQPWISARHRWETVGWYHATPRALSSSSPPPTARAARPRSPVSPTTTRRVRRPTPRGRQHRRALSASCAAGWSRRGRLRLAKPFQVRLDDGPSHDGGGGVSVTRGVDRDLLGLVGPLERPLPLARNQVKPREVVENDGTRRILVLRALAAASSNNSRERAMSPAHFAVNPYLVVGRLSASMNPAVRSSSRARSKSSRRKPSPCENEACATALSASASRARSPERSACPCGEEPSVRARPRQKTLPEPRRRRDRIAAGEVVVAPARPSSSNQRSRGRAVALVPGSVASC